MLYMWDRMSSNENLVILSKYWALFLLMATFISDQERILNWPALLMQANAHRHNLFFSTYFFSYFYFFFQTVTHLLNPTLQNNSLIRITLETHDLMTLPVEKLQTEPTTRDVTLEAHVVTLDFCNLVRIVDLYVHV